VSPDGVKVRADETFSMDEQLVDRIAWRRRSRRQQYLGRLLLLPDRLRLVGRDAEWGIDVALSIPFGEIEAVRAAASATESVLGEAGIVVELAGSEPIFLRELGSRGEPRRLATRLSSVVAPRPDLAVSA
jgi:hypothetical protein